jgi:hypothetical protein
MFLPVRGGFGEIRSRLCRVSTGLDGNGKSEVVQAKLIGQHVGLYRASDDRLLRYAELHDEVDVEAATLHLSNGAMATGVQPSTSSRRVRSASTTAWRS